MKETRLYLNIFQAQSIDESTYVKYQMFKTANNNRNVQTKLIKMQHTFLNRVCTYTCRNWIGFLLLKAFYIDSIDRTYILFVMGIGLFN